MASASNSRTWEIKFWNAKPPHPHELVEICLQQMPVCTEMLFMFCSPSATCFRCYYTRVGIYKVNWVVNYQLQISLREIHETTISTPQIWHNACARKDELIDDWQQSVSCSVCNRNHEYICWYLGPLPQKPIVALLDDQRCTFASPEDTRRG